MNPRQFNRQIDTIPEYENDNVTTVQSKTNNRPSPPPNASPIINTNRTIAKRTGNQAIPVANKTDTFVHIPEKVTIEKNLTGRNKSFYDHFLLLSFR